MSALPANAKTGGGAAPPAAAHLYQPHLMTVERVIDETPDTRTFQLVFNDPAAAEAFSFKAGQFGEYSLFGAGEATFCIASPPTRLDAIECTFKAVGKVTRAMRDVNPGDTLGFRGPYGNHFPVDDWKGKNIVFVAGGIGLAPVRCVISNVLDRRDEFGDVTIVYGARTVADLVYKRELEEWGGATTCAWCRPSTPAGRPRIGPARSAYVTPVVEQTAPSAENAVAVLCGPPIVVKLTLPVLEKLGFSDDHVYTTLENRMKCGVGKCGRCNIGSVYVCKDGPVFTAAQMKALPAEF